MQESTDVPQTVAPEAGQIALDGFDPVPALARELGLPPAGVAAAVALLDEGNTVPFIARYRKERTGGLDEVQLRAIEERRAYLVELEQRRRAITASIAEQGKLDAELAGKLAAATTKADLEDLYAPYRPRRKTRASVARERGLEPLALRILAQPHEGDPRAEAAALVSAERGVATAEDALAGARDIVAERVADTAEVRAAVRRLYAESGELCSEVMPGKGDEPTKFELYYGFREAVRTIPSHRFLAIRRGEAEGVLRATVVVDAERVHQAIARLVAVDDRSPFSGALREAIADAQKRLLAPSVENDIRAELKARSDVAAVDIFAANLRNLMLSAPLGTKAVIGVDPGLRTGCKCAAIAPTGRFLGTVTVYLSQGEGQLARAKDDFLAFVKAHEPAAVAVGNGTGGREAEAWVRRTLAEAGHPLPVISVNEAGASVYSASDLAREEFPELDLTIRGAISIARRLQDPLAELVKIEPKAIGVGQYQHDVHQPLLTKKLGDVVESCVNHVGVELNTASAQLLQYVAGIGKSLAKKIVGFRDASGGFTSRAQLREVSGLGPRAFEQAAGFLRIRGAAHPLDASAVHPERYALVEKMAAQAGVEVGALVGNQALVDAIDLSRYVDDTVGEPTLRDIVAELKKPGLDPRAELEPPRFRDDVTTMEDLKQGMVLEGIVTNVTAFGAFVDIGVHNDGLIHVSRLADKFVSSPSEVVKVGQRIKVRVLEVDSARRRIGLTARLSEEGAPGRGAKRGPERNDRGGEGQQGRPAEGQADRPRGGRGRGRGQGGEGRAPHPAAAGEGGAPSDRGERRPPGEGRPPGEVRQGGGAREQQADARGPNRPGGGRDDRGPSRPSGGRDDRGPNRPGGGRDDRGPNRPGGGRDDRGRPASGRDDRPGPSGARDDRQAPGGRRDDGQAAGGRRDDRGPARPPGRDERPAGGRGGREERPESTPGYGISGFVNNPFANLSLPKNKR